MNALAAITPLARDVGMSPPRPDPAEYAVVVAGVKLALLPEGGLWWPEERMLIVADLHFEKGSSFARRGQFLPPYDTGATLGRVERLAAATGPATIVALGDSFHEDGAAERLAGPDRERLAALQRGRSWIWIAGNHDRAPPHGVGGDCAAEVRTGALTFRHEPTNGPAPGEIAGHLHPAARVFGSLGSVRRRCFVGDGARLVLPALGAYAGGLNVLEAPFRPLFAGRFAAHLLGAGAIYRVDPARLCRD